MPAVLGQQAELRCRITRRGDVLSMNAGDIGAIYEGAPDDFSRGAALIAAMLSFAAPDIDLLSRDLDELGFGGLSVLEADESDSERVGMAAAERREDGRVLTLAVIFPTQGAQWYSNFRVGYSAEHSGFGRAADIAEDHLCRYLCGRGQEQRSFFVTGYSRGGAVANILSRRLCDRYGVDNVRGYTFASPNTAIRPRRADYGPIFNLVRSQDFFTRVPLSGWGYERYGRDIILGADIGEEYRRLTGEDYTGFSAEQVDAVLDAVQALAPNVHAYYARRYPVGGRRLSLSDYMNSTAAMLAQDAAGDELSVIVDGAASQFADLSDFLMTGADIGDLLCGAQGIPRCSVADSHSPAAYMAALLNEGSLA